MTRTINLTRKVDLLIFPLVSLVKNAQNSCWNFSENSYSSIFFYIMHAYSNIFKPCLQFDVFSTKRQWALLATELYFFRFVIKRSRRRRWPTPRRSSESQKLRRGLNRRRAGESHYDGVKGGKALHGKYVLLLILHLYYSSKVCTTPDPRIMLFLGANNIPY